MTFKFSQNFGLKFVLVNLVGAILLVFAVLLAGGLYLNYLQKQTVKEAVQLAQDQARRLAADVMEAYDMKQGDVRSPQFSQRVKQLTEVVIRRNHDIVWAGVFDASGQKIIEDVDDGSGERKFSMLPDDGSSYKRSLKEDGESNGFEIEVRGGNSTREISQPLIRDGKQVGEIVLRINQSPEFARIIRSSSQITKILVVELIVLLLAMGALFYVLWRIFVRHMLLLRQNAQLDRLAYVGGMASGLAHEIRNPLGAISLNMQLVREELEQSGEEQNEHAVRMVKAVDMEIAHLNETLSRFLDFAVPRKEAFIQFSLIELVEEILRLHIPILERNAMTWRMETPKDEEALVEGDRRLLHQVFANVILNAIQMMESSLKRNLSIAVVPYGSADWHVRVHDTGPGIASEDLSRIFEVFVSRRRGGSGLGLPTAKRIVEDHGGRIWAENNPDGLGAVLHIVLPKRGTVSHGAE